MYQVCEKLQILSITFCIKYVRFIFCILGPTQAGYPQGGSAQTQGLGQGKFLSHFILNLVFHV